MFKDTVEGLPGPGRFDVSAADEAALDDLYGLCIEYFSYPAGDGPTCHACEIKGIDDEFDTLHQWGMRDRE